MPLFWLSLAFLSGILIAEEIALPLYGWAMLAFFSLLLMMPPVIRRWSQLHPPTLVKVNQQLKIPGNRIYPLLLTFMVIGAIRYQTSQPVMDSTFIAYYNDLPAMLILEGVVIEPPDVRDSYTNLRIKVDQLRPADEENVTIVRGLLLARVTQNTNVGYGDRVSLQGKLTTPSENDDFSYRDYLARQSIYSYMSFGKVDLLKHGQGNPFYAGLYSLRERAREAVYKLYPDPEASLIAGIVLGVQTGIPERVQEAFRLTGTSHIIVISGFNISIIASVITRLFRRWLGLYRGALVALVGISLYTLFVGANAAVVRAAILGIFTLGGQLVGRRQSGLNSLTFAGAMMAVANPNVLWDVSFQLSFAATLGIMLYAEPLIQVFIKFATRYMPQARAERLAGPVGDYFLITLAAQVTTLPLMIYYFKRFSLTSLIANPLILPVQPALMELGGVAVLTGLLILPLGQIFAWTAWPFTAYTIRVVEWLAKLQHGSIVLGQLALPIFLLLYVVLFVFTSARSKLPTLLARLTPAYPLIAVGVITVLVWKAAFYAPDQLLHVTILDVGTGDAVLLQSPTGRYVLINGGASTRILSDALGRRLPPFNHALDWLVVADIDSEDLAGVAGNLERFSPSNILWSGNNYGSRAAAVLWTELISKPYPITHMQPGQKLDLGSGVELQVISVDARGAVLLLSWDNFRLLLPIGMDAEALDNLSNNMAMRNISAVLLAESGYAPLNPPELISALRPQVTLLSVAPADKTGLPSAETLNALKGYNLLRTDENGWIEITTDGKQMWVEVERR